MNWKDPQTLVRTAGDPKAFPVSFSSLKMDTLKGIATWIKSALALWYFTSQKNWLNIHIKHVWQTDPELSMESVSEKKFNFGTFRRSSFHCDYQNPDDIRPILLKTAVDKLWWKTSHRSFWKKKHYFECCEKPKPTTLLAFLPFSIN